MGSRIKNNVVGVAMLAIVFVNLAGCAGAWQKTASLAGQVNAATSPTPVDASATTQPAVATIRPIIAAVGQSYPPLDLIISAIGAISGIVYGVASKMQSNKAQTLVKAHQNALAELNSLLPPTANLTPATRKLVHASQST